MDEVQIEGLQEYPEPVNGASSLRSGPCLTGSSATDKNRNYTADLPMNAQAGECDG